MRQQSYPKYLLAVFILLTLVFCFSRPSYSENKRIFKTVYCSIHYFSDEDLSGFLWKISGRRFDLESELELARSRVDRITDRVKYLLDMNPPYFHVDVLLYPEYKEGDIASYDPDENNILVYVDKVTDGVFAHEIAHAVICDFFDAPPPGKMQEILTQYVDKHLWEEY